MNLLFLCGTHLNCNSGVHIFNLANQLAALGHECVVGVPEKPGETAALGRANFATTTFDALADEQNLFSDRRRPTLVHAWTPRENVRIATEAQVGRFGCPYIVHLEDNEEHLLQTRLGLPYADLRRMPAGELDRLVPAHTAHPVRYRRFLARAAGVTAVIDTLLEFKPHHIPGRVFWPAADSTLKWSAPADPRLRRRIGIPTDAQVVAYTGNVHHANRREVASLYIAIGILNRRGLPVKLLRTGVDTAPLFDAVGAAALAPHVIELGFLPRHEIPPLLALADACVQPGGPGDFNSYRFPSKLPEYFAAGKAVVLPGCNLGCHLEDGVNACLMERGDAMEIVRILEQILPDPGLRRRMANNAAMFAAENFSWSRNALVVASLYCEALSHDCGAAVQECDKFD